MKRSIIFTFSLLLATLCLNAQTEVKINPIGALFGSPDVSAEFGISENFGVEVGLGVNLGKNTIGDVEFSRSGFGGFLAGKYYFNPNEGIDRFGIGLYTRFRNISNNAKLAEEEVNNFERSLIAGGLMITQKWVSQSGVIFEIDFGAGRAFKNDITFDDNTNSEISLDDIPGLNIDVILRFAIGYRF